MTVFTDEHRNADTSFSEIVGYADVKQTFRNLLNHLKAIASDTVSANSNFSNCILIHGPRGTGKSTFLRILAENAPIETWLETGSTFLAQGVDSIGALRYLFFGDNTLIIIDNIDLIVSRRNPTTMTKDQRTREALSQQLLSELEQLKTRENVFFVASTSRREALDPAFLQLMNHEIEIKLPDYEIRRKLLQRYNDIYNHNWAASFLDKVADMTIGASGRKIERLITSAGQISDRKRAQRIRDVATATNDLIAYPVEQESPYPAYLAGTADTESIVRIQMLVQEPDEGAVPRDYIMEADVNELGTWMIGGLSFPPETQIQATVTTVSGASVDLDFTISHSINETDESHLLKAMENEGLSIPDISNRQRMAHKLDQYVVGQEAAKSKVIKGAIAHYNHARNLDNQLSENINLETNILLAGPHGIGKSVLAEGLSQALNVPYAYANATQLLSSENNETELQRLFRRLYEQSDGDMMRAEHGIIYLYNIDKLESVNSPNHTNSQYSKKSDQIQERLNAVINGETIEIEIISTDGSKQPVSMETGSILYICAGVFNPESQRAQDFVNYGLSPALVQSLSIIIKMEPLSKGDIEQIIDKQWDRILNALGQILPRPGVSIELNDMGRKKLVDELHEMKIGSDEIAPIIRDIFFYVSEELPDDSDHFVVNQEIVRQILSLREIAPTDNRSSGLTEIPNVTYDDIAGLGNQVERIRREIEFPIRFGKKYQRYGLDRPRGILLYGPPGTGKTMIAKAIANSLSNQAKNDLQKIRVWYALFQALNESSDVVKVVEDWVNMEEENYRFINADLIQRFSQMTHTELQEALLEDLENMGLDRAQLDYQVQQVRLTLKRGNQNNFISVKGPELSDKYVGETPRKIRELFAQARALASPTLPVVIFFDEMEALFSERGGSQSSAINNSAVPQILTEMDGMDDLNNVIVIGATNREDLLDAALTRPGRFDIMMEVPRADKTAAKQLAFHYLTPNQEIGDGGEVFHETLIRQFSADGGDEDALIAAICAHLADRMVNFIYDVESFISVKGHHFGNPDKFDKRGWGQFVSGAIINNIVDAAKKKALKEEIEKELSGQPASGGITWSILRDSIITHFEENKKKYAKEIYKPHVLHGDDVNSFVFTSSYASEDDVKSVNVWSLPIKRPWKYAMKSETSVNS